MFIVYKATGPATGDAYYGYCAGSDPRPAFSQNAKTYDEERGDARLVALNKCDVSEIGFEILETVERELDAWFLRNEYRSTEPDAITKATLWPYHLSEEAKVSFPGRLKGVTAKTAREAYHAGRWTYDEVIALQAKGFASKEVTSDLDTLTPREFNKKYFEATVLGKPVILPVQPKEIPTMSTLAAQSSYNRLLDHVPTEELQAALAQRTAAKPTPPTVQRMIASIERGKAKKATFTPKSSAHSVVTIHTYKHASTAVLKAGNVLRPITEAVLAAGSNQTHWNNALRDFENQIQINPDNSILITSDITATTPAAIKRLFRFASSYTGSWARDWHIGNIRIQNLENSDPRRKWFV